jgi:predicted PurR-regulated permease PerM
MRHLLVGWTARGAGLALGAGGVFLLATLLASALNVLALVFIAVLLATALEPFIGWIRARAPIVPRGAAILGVYLAFFALVAAFCVFVLPIAAGQATESIGRIPKLLDDTDAWAATLPQEQLRETVQSLVDAARARLDVQAPSPDVVVQAGLTLAEVFAAVGTTLAIVFFWLVSHARLQRYALAFVPIDRRGGVRRAWNDIENRLGRWFRGQLVLMGAVGVMCGVAYVVLGLPSALLIALIAALCEGIPMVGPLLGAIPAALAALTVSPELLVAVLIVTAIIQFVENNVLVPVVMRNSIGLSPLIVTVSLLVGAAAGGLLGAVVAVPVAAAIEVILGRLQDREVPVAQDTSAVETADLANDEVQAGLPDSREGSRTEPRRRASGTAAGSDPETEGSGAT